jgi:hypothetical protein
MTLGLPLLGL